MEKTPEEIATKFLEWLYSESWGSPEFSRGPGSGWLQEVTRLAGLISSERDRVRELEAELGELKIVERILGPAPDRLANQLRYSAAADALKQHKSDDLILAELRHIILEADHSELMDWARERAEYAEEQAARRGEK